jgi:hypothetical protein
MLFKIRCSIASSTRINASCYNTMACLRCALNPDLRSHAVTPYCVAFLLLLLLPCAALHCMQCYAPYIYIFADSLLGPAAPRRLLANPAVRHRWLHYTQCSAACCLPLPTT